MSTSTPSTPSTPSTEPSRGRAVRSSFNALIDRITSRFADVSGTPINMSGPWYAAWQTSVDGEEIVTTQPVEFKQRGRRMRAKNLRPSTEHPKGGYLWESQMEVRHDLHLAGTYHAVGSENNTSHGTLYLYHRPQQGRFYGMWVGASFDGVLTSGLVVVAETREEASTTLHRIMDSNPDQVVVKVDGMGVG